jgi:hypothetical protein
LAQPPPLTFVVNHGIQVLANMATAKSATNQPGRRRRCMVARLADHAVAPARHAGVPPRVC